MIGQVNDLYNHKCEHCGGFIEDLSDDGINWDNIYSKIAQELLNNPDIKINADLHLNTAKRLSKGLNEALGTDLAYDSERAILSEYLQRNIYAFSAAKSLVQMKYYRDTMIGDDGKIISKGAYIKKIADTGEIFNRTHLAAEYENAYQSAIMAHKWETLDAEYLQYTTVGDRNVRPEHQALDKFTAAKSDPVWRRIYPPNGWNCRCSVIPGKENRANEGLTSIEAEKMMKPILKDTPFDNNVGISKTVFDAEHPYFINSKGKETNLSWKEYGMPNLDKIRTEELPEYKSGTKEDFLKWWDKQPKHKDNDIAVRDPLGQEVLLQSHEGKRGKPTGFFKEHIFDNNNNRENFALEVPNVIKSPDEIWFNPKDKNSRTYIKYYEQGTLKMVVNQNMQAVTMFEILDKYTGELDKSRRGILYYRK